MTDPQPDQPEQRQGAVTDLPRTGEPEVDRTLESLQGLESAPLADHHDRLARVHEELHAALNADRSRTGS